MPGQLKELAIANETAEMQKTAYLQHSANNVDEKTVKMLGASDIEAGQQLYAKNCVACHGDKGQGGVGPNFTDEYWLHKGSIQDIFYSIKYGWQEKGMKAWKEDFSPNQIAQLASFINSIKNTKVPGGKEKQGEIYTDTAAVAVMAIAPEKSK
jgi:cytochrome c oxidase cbb3-type subunit 3